MVNPKPTCAVRRPRPGSLRWRQRDIHSRSGRRHGWVQLLWSNGATTPSITVSEANTYTVTVTDSKGCTTEPARARSWSIRSRPAGGTSHERSMRWRQRDVHSAPVGGTPGYSYLWSNGATTPSITVSEANTYTVTVTDSKGCTTELRGHVRGQSEADLRGWERPRRKFALGGSAHSQRSRSAARLGTATCGATVRRRRASR